ncbi:MAG: substrate-binding domain-containing protein [Gammaproteobacteria bacterium]|nr:substrate-binding domain-containing protein [Gammaproteobacteria bacterium]MDE2250556.1 substrate-binding domain-containing protein [Gammaproteobacteria bacterium]
MRRRPLAAARVWPRVGLACLGLVAQGAVAEAFDLSALPHYQPTHQVTGTIRNFGYSLGGMMDTWEQGFRSFQPGVSFDDKYPSGDAAIAGLVSGVSDLGPQGREQTLIEHLMFFETFGYAASAVTVATGAFDVEGMADGLVVFVNKDNPLSRLTVQQLDGIFGAERTGSFDGFKWTLPNARGVEQNLRTWGQLGLVGEWAGQEIHTYGHAPSGTANYFQLRVLKGSDKWNPNYRQYVETGSKMIGADDKTMRGGLHHMLADELAHDRYGIAWSVLPQARGATGIKALALAANAAGPYVVPSPQSFQDHSYPLSRSIYIYFNRAPGKALDPKLQEFLRYILSQEGQAALQRAGKYLPLTAELAREQLRQLD